MRGASDLPPPASQRRLANAALVSRRDGERVREPRRARIRFCGGKATYRLAVTGRDAPHFEARVYARFEVRRLGCDGGSNDDDASKKGGAARARHDEHNFQPADACQSPMTGMGRGQGGGRG